MKNLLNVFDKTGLILFDQIDPHSIPGNVKALLKQNQNALNLILKKPKSKTQNETYTFENLLFPLEIIRNNVKNVWSVIEHFNAVLGTPEWQKAYQKSIGLFSEFNIRLKQNKELYIAVLGIKNSPQYSHYTAQQKKVIDNFIRDCQLVGVNLSLEKKSALKQNQKNILEFENKFAKNILNSTLNRSILIKNKSELKGVPETFLETMRMAAHSINKNGYLITLDYSIYNAVMSNAANQNLRKKLYTAYVTLASDQSSQKKLNNNPIMISLLKERQKLAEHLGFRHYAEYALSTRMLKTPKEVNAFLEKLLITFKRKAKKELNDLKKLGLKYGLKTINPWDLSFLAERKCEQIFSLKTEKLRDYFAETKVLDGLFKILNALYAIKIKEVKKFPSWHDSIKLYEIYDKHNHLVAKFYLDLYERDGKKKGAWYSDCKTRIQWQNKILQRPVAHIVANFRNKAPNDSQAYLSHVEIVTLFHEFGHALHHMLTRVDYPSISGGNGVSWDAIEVPSQFMENWCFEDHSLKLISKEKHSDKTMPQSLMKKIIKERSFLNGLAMLRQLELSLIDFKLHSQTNIRTYSEIQKRVASVQKKTSLLKPPKFNRYLNTFSHIFAGPYPYAAGYYSYLWSGIMSSDIFSTFNTRKSGFDKKQATQFLEKILQKGGSKEFIELFQDFMHRKPNIKAFFKQKL